MMVSCTYPVLQDAIKYQAHILYLTSTRHTGKKLIRELTGHGGGFLIRDRVCLCPAGEVVSHHQDVCVASR